MEDSRALCCTCCGRQGERETMQQCNRCGLAAFCSVDCLQRNWYSWEGDGGLHHLICNKVGLANLFSLHIEGKRGAQEAGLGDPGTMRGREQLDRVPAAPLRFATPPPQQPEQAQPQAQQQEEAGGDDDMATDGGQTRRGRKRGRLEASEGDDPSSEREMAGEFGGGTMRDDDGAGGGAKRRRLWGDFDPRSEAWQLMNSDQRRFRLGQLPVDEFAALYNRFRPVRGVVDTARDQFIYTSTQIHPQVREYMRARGITLRDLFSGWEHRLPPGFNWLQAYTLLAQLQPANEEDSHIPHALATQLKRHGATPILQMLKDLGALGDHPHHHASS